MLRVPLLIAVAAVAAAAATAAPAARSACGADGYAYAGLQSAHRGHGVRAVVSSRSVPRVRSGHVAAWVGVGGIGLGPGGTNAWLQVGLSAFADGVTRLYYEVARPGAAPRYHELEASVGPRRAVDVAVLELARKPEWWRVWVDGKPIGEPVHLPGSSGRWRPMAVAESWVSGAGPCNAFSYRFRRVRVAQARGGSWAPLVAGYRWQDGSYRVLEQARASFDAVGA